jgi:hypothetical protein
MAKRKSVAERVDLSGVSGEKVPSRQQVLQQYLGQPIAVLCARFAYRGVLSAVGDDYLILAQARAVESSGASNSDRPNSEDPIGSSVMVSLDALELVYQPNWCFASLDD